MVNSDLWTPDKAPVVFHLPAQNPVEKLHERIARLERRLARAEMALEAIRIASAKPGFSPETTLRVTHDIAMSVKGGRS